MNKTKINPCEEFKTQLWLYLEKSLSKKEMLSWDDHLSNCDICKKLLNESLETINSYDAVPPEDLTNADYERMINKATTIQIVKKPDKTSNRRTLPEVIGFYKLTFGGAMILAAIIFLMITFINNPKLPEIKNDIPVHLLSWKNERVKERISNLEDQIISLKIDDWDIYLVKNNRKEKWDNAVRSIQKQIRKIKKQTESPAL